MNDKFYFGIGAFVLFYLFLEALSTTGDNMYFPNPWATLLFDNFDLSLMCDKLYLGTGAFIQIQTEQFLGPIPIQDDLMLLVIK